MSEHELTVLTRSLPKHHLEAGDGGTVVHVYDGGKGFEVEFAAGDGRYVAVVTLDANDVRPISGVEIFHARTGRLISS